VFASKYSGGTCKIEREQDVRTNIRSLQIHCVRNSNRLIYFHPPSTAFSPTEQVSAIRGRFRRAEQHGFAISFSFFSLLSLFFLFFLFFFFSQQARRQDMMRRAAGWRQLDGVGINRVD